MESAYWENRLIWIFSQPYYNMNGENRMKRFQQYKLVLRLAIPILCNYFVTTSFEFMDQTIVGHYSTQAYAAVGVISRLIYVLTGSFGIFTSAFHITAAKCLADQNEVAFEQTFRIALRCVHIIGGIFTGCILLFGKIICQNMLGLNGEVLNTAVAYLYPAGITLWMNLILFTFSAYYRNRLNTKISLISTIITTAVNLFFDYSLVYGRFGMPELGGSGAAWGSVIGLFAGILVYLVVYEIRDQNCQAKGQKICISQQRKSMIHLYIPLLIQDIMECSVFTMVLSAMIGRLMVTQIALYGLLDALGNMIVLPVFAFSQAGLTLAIQQDRRQKNSYCFIRSARIMAFAAVGGLGGITIRFPVQIVQLMIGDRTMDTHVAQMLPLIVLIQLIRVFYELDKTYLQGTGDENFVCQRSIVILMCSLVYLGILIYHYQVLGAYIGILITHMIFGICYHRRIRKR